MSDSTTSPIDELRYWEGLPVLRVPLSALWAVFHQDPNRPQMFDAIKESLTRDGQANPLLCTPMHHSDIIRSWQRKIGGLIPDDGKAHPYRIVIIVGNQRYFAMKALGWTHADIVLLPNHHIARQMSPLCRKGWDDIYSLDRV